MDLIVFSGATRLGWAYTGNDVTEGYIEKWQQFGDLTLAIREESQAPE